MRRIIIEEYTNHPQITAIKKDNFNEKARKIELEYDLRKKLIIEKEKKDIWYGITHIKDNKELEKLKKKYKKWKKNDKKGD